MDAGVLDVLDDRRGHDLALVGHGVELDFLGVHDELRDDDRILGGYPGGPLEIALQVAFVENDAHGGPAQDIGGADEDGIADAPGEGPRLADAPELPPLGLVHPELVQEP